MKQTAHHWDLTVPVSPENAVTGLQWESPVLSLAESRPEAPAASASRVTGAVGWVTLLAFGQAIGFLALWLFVCANAGAASTNTAEFNPELQLSNYHPTKSRAPITKVGALNTEVKLAPGVTVPLVLEGIIYERANPSAIINGSLVLLNKTVTLSTTSGEIQARAVEIGRDKVVLEVGTNRIELRLTSGKAEPRADR